MRRLILGPLAVCVLASCLALTPGSSHARADVAQVYQGTWKVTALFPTNEMLLWLVKIDKKKVKEEEEKDKVKKGKEKEVETVEIVDGLRHAQMRIDVRTTKASDLKTSAKNVRCKLLLSNGVVFNLTAYPVEKKDKGKAKGKEEAKEVMYGSVRLNMSDFLRVRLEKTEDNTIDPDKAVKNFAGHADLRAALDEKVKDDEKIKELQNILKDHEGKPITHLASQALISYLAQEKKEAKEFEGPAKTYLAQVEPYGHEITVGANMELGLMLTGYDKTQALGLSYAKKASDLVTQDDPEGLATSAHLAYLFALDKNKKGAESKEVVAKLEKSAEALIKSAKTDAVKFPLTHQVASMLLGSPNAGAQDLGLKHARELEKQLTDKDDDNKKLIVLHLFNEGLKKRGKDDEVKKVSARIEVIETALDKKFEKQNVDFDVEKFGKRKGKSQRVVLVELFTGAQCRPCVAADVAFDAAMQSYKSSEVVFLQYHLHVPGPDALTNADTEARQRFYGDEEVAGTPTMFIDGKVTTPMGGGKPVASQRYESLKELVDKAVEEKEGGKLALKVSREGNKIDVKADVSDLEKANARLKLHFALIEDVARYQGGNGQRLHHHVVRALPAGPKGIAMKEKSGSYEASVDVAEVKKKLDKYLTDFATKNRIQMSQRPMELRRLKVVAFIQDDDSKQVHQAAQVDVPEAKESDVKKEEKKDKDEKKDDKKDKEEKKDKK